MVIFPLAPDQTIAQMWSNGARGGYRAGFRKNWYPIDQHMCKFLVTDDWYQILPVLVPVSVACVAGIRG